MARFDTINTAQGYGTTGLGVAGLIAGHTAAGAAGTGAAGALAAVGSAATVIGLVATPIILLLGKIFHGADPRQVPVAKIEQAFEAGALNLLAVGKAGMISRSEATAGMRVFLKKGQEFYAQPDIKALGPSVARGKANMEMVINAQIESATREVAESRTASLDLSAAQRAYIPLSLGVPGKWYLESLQAATKLTDTYLSSLPTNAVEKVSSMLAAPVFEKFPIPVWLAGVLSLAGGWAFKRFA